MVGGGGERGGAHAPGTFTQFYELDLGWFSARNILFCSIITLTAHSLALSSVPSTATPFTWYLLYVDSTKEPLAVIRALSPVQLVELCKPTQILHF